MSETDSGKLSQTPPFSIPSARKVFGEYDLLERLGKGAMGEVYKARLSRHNTGFVRYVAIKLIPSDHFDDDQYVRMLISEARLGGLLHHPNIINTLDLNDDEGQWGLVMEYVDGSHLGTVIQRCRKHGSTIPPDIAIQIMIEVCMGLEFAHAALDDQLQPLNMVHRDLKPSNLMLSQNGEVKICDFGVARASNAAHVRTETGVTKGTPAYMAREQVKGQSDIDRRADIFSVGAVLFELLTLEALNSAPNAHALYFQAGFEDFRGRLVRLPATSYQTQLKRAIAGAIAPDRDDRYATAGEFAAALKEIRSHIPDQHDLRSWCATICRTIRLDPKPPSSVIHELSPVDLEVLPPNGHQLGPIEAGDDLRRVTAPTIPGDTFQLPTVVVFKKNRLRWMAAGALLLAALALTLKSWTPMDTRSTPETAAAESLRTVDRSLLPPLSIGPSANAVAASAATPAAVTGQAASQTGNAVDEAAAYHGSDPDAASPTSVGETLSSTIQRASSIAPTSVAQNSGKKPSGTVTTILEPALTSPVPNSGKRPTGNVGGKKAASSTLTGQLPTTPTVTTLEEPPSDSAALTSTLIANAEPCLPIELNGKTSECPIRGKLVTPGTHILRFQDAEGKTLEKTIHLESGTTQRCFANMAVRPPDISCVVD